MDTTREHTDSKPEATPTERTLDDRVISACAEACKVDQQLIEHVCHATPEQEDRMNHHIETGTYLEQIVMQFDHMASVDQLNFLIQVVETVRSKNQILRTRLVNHEDAVYQVVTRGRIQCAAEGDLKRYITRNTNTRMGYGSELCRYALINDEHGENFSIWTVHHSCVDSWIMHSIFDDLSRPVQISAASHKRNYSFNLASALHLRHSHYALSETGDYKVPIFEPLDLFTVSDARASRTLHVQGTRLHIKLSVIGHAAWALTVYEECGNPDVNFISTSFVRNIDLPGIVNVMSPVSTQISIRVTLDDSMTVEGLQNIIEHQMLSTVGVEHCVMRGLRSETIDWNSLTQGVFQWHLLGSDICNRTIACHDRNATPTILRYRSDLSVPASHGHTFMLDIWEQDDYINIHASWDSRMLEWDKVRHVMKRFALFFTAILKDQGKTVGKMMGQYLEIKRKATPSAAFPSNSRASSIEFEEFKD